MPLSKLICISNMSPKVKTKRLYFPESLIFPEGSITAVYHSVNCGIPPFGSWLRNGQVYCGPCMDLTATNIHIWGHNSIGIYFTWGHPSLIQRKVWLSWLLVISCHILMLKLISSLHHYLDLRPIEMINRRRLSCGQFSNLKICIQWNLVVGDMNHIIPCCPVAAAPIRIKLSYMLM